MTTKNTKYMGKHEKSMYEFALRNLGGGRLHSLAKDKLTQKTAKRLIDRGLIVVNNYGQFTLRED